MASLLSDEDEDEFTQTKPKTSVVEVDYEADLEDAPEVEAPEVPAVADYSPPAQPKIEQPQVDLEQIAPPATQQRQMYQQPEPERPHDVQRALQVRNELISQPYEPVSHMGAVDPREELRLQAASQQMEEQSRREREAQRRQIDKGLKAQGVEFETDALGNESIVTHEDGSPKFKAGVVKDFEWHGQTPTRVERDAYGNKSRVSILEAGTPGKDYHRDDASGEFFVDTKEGRQWLGARDDDYLTQKRLAAIQAKSRAERGMDYAELNDATARMRELKTAHGEQWAFMDETEADLTATVAKRMKEASEGSILPDVTSWLPGGQTREYKAKIATDEARKAEKAFRESLEYKARQEFQELEVKRADLQKRLRERRRREAAIALNITNLKYGLSLPQAEIEEDRREFDSRSGVGGSDVRQPAQYSPSMIEESETGSTVKPDALLDRATAMASATGRKVEEMMPIARAEAQKHGFNTVEPEEAPEKKLYRVADGKITFGTGDPLKGLEQAVRNGDITTEAAVEEVRRITNPPVKGNGVGRGQDHAWRALIATSNSVNGAFAGLARFVGADDLAQQFSDRVTTGEKSMRGKGAITNPELDNSWGAALSETAGEIAAMAPGLVVGGGAGTAVRAGAGLFNALKIGTLAPRLIGVLPMGIQGAATAQDAAFRKAKEEGKNDDEAEALGNQAALKTLPYLALVTAAGALTEKALRPLTRIYPILETPFARGLTAAGIDAPLNVGASLAGQFATGEEVKLDAKSLATDIAFSLLAGHHASQAAKFLPTARAMADGSHPEVQMLRATAADKTVARDIRKAAYDQANQVQRGAQHAINELGARPEGAAVEHIAAMNRLRELDASPDSAKVRDERAEVSEAANRALGRMVNSDQAATEAVLRELVQTENLGAAAKVIARENPGDAGAAVLARLGEKAVQSGVIPPSILKKLEATVAHVPEANRSAVLNHAIGAAVFGDAYMPILKGDAVSKGNLGYLSVLQEAGIGVVTPEGRSKLNVNYLFMLPKGMREQIARNPGDVVAGGDGLRDVARVIREGRTGVVGASEKLAAESKPEPESARPSDPQRSQDQAERESAELDREYIDAIPDEIIPFSRSNKEPASGLKKADAEKAVNGVSKRFPSTPAVEVIQGYDDLPPAVREEYRAKGVNAFYDSATGKVTVIADRMTSPAEAAKTALHEIVGHHGLRGAFGDKLQTVVDRMVIENRKGVSETAKRLGLDLKEPAHRREAAEEYIAEMAEAGGAQGKGFVNWMKGMLQKAFPGIQFEDDYVRGVLQASRDYLEGKKEGSIQGSDIRFSKAEVGMRLRDVGPDFVRDDAEARFLETKGSTNDIATQAAGVFASWPKTVIAADGSSILLKNPERGSMGTRIKHLLFDNDGGFLNREKAKWIPMVPDTIKNAAVRIIDSDSGNRIYVREYQTGDKHMVVIRPNGAVIEQKAFRGALITQFPEGARGRQAHMLIDWVRPDEQGKMPPSPVSPTSATGAAPERTDRPGTASGRSQGNPVPTPIDSTHPDARQSEFRNDGKTSDGENQADSGDVRFSRSGNATHINTLSSERDSLTRVKQVEAPKHFESVDDVLKFRSQRIQEATELYKEQIGLSDEDAGILERLVRNGNSTDRFERRLTPEQKEKLDYFFEESPLNRIDGPFEYWDGNQDFNPESIHGETNKSELAVELIRAVDPFAAASRHKPS